MEAARRYGLLTFVLLLFCYSAAAQAKSADPLIEVFIIPHSHCDAGWLETMETYFHENVSLILDQVTQSLVSDGTKKFCWSEIVFFQMWWVLQNSSWQSKVRDLISTGRLEFVGAGWVQNDEAAAYYVSVIDQMTLGHQFLLDEFGVKPVVGWQIDPFGASSLTPTLWNLSGIQYHVINRIDERLKRPYTWVPYVPGSGSFLLQRKFEFYWRASKNYGQSADIFTHVLDNHYSTPQICWPNATDTTHVSQICTGFDFEGGLPTNPPVNSTNLQDRADIFAGILKNRSSYYIHNKLLIPFGMDFRYQNASVEFTSMDLLVAHINRNANAYGVTLKYATPIEYFDAVVGVTKKSDFPLVLNRDYFTYTLCNPYEYVYYNTCAFYWSGFYSSYPVLKEYSRSRDALLRAADILYGIGRALHSHPFYKTVNWALAFDQLDILRKASAVLTHHDAITGTSRSYVLADYHNMLESGTNATNQALETVVGFLQSRTATPVLSADLSQLGNPIPGQVIPVTLYNSLGWQRAETVKLLIPFTAAKVFDGTGNEIASQVVEDFACANIPKITCGYYLFFPVTIPALGFNTYFVQYLRKEVAPLSTKWKKLKPSVPITLENTYFQFNFELNATDRLYHLSSAYNKLDKLAFSLRHDLLQYTGILDDPYKFRPNGTAKLVEPSTPHVYFAPGILVQQLALVYTQNVTVIYRLYDQLGNSSSEFGNFLEVDHWVALAVNREMISRFTSEDINSEGGFFTDNGLELQERTYEERFNDSFTWSMVAGNYYPVISTLSLTDGVRQLTLLTNQTVGGSSQQDGSLEIMLHRRTNGTHWSLNETQNDTNTAHVAIRLEIGGRASIERDRVPISYGHQFPLLPLYGVPVLLENDDLVQEFIYNWTNLYYLEFSPLHEDLPPNLHLVGLKALTAESASTILRFVHLYEAGQDPLYSKPATLELDNFFKDVNFSAYREATLTGTETISSAEVGTYLFEPIQLRTFVVDIK